MASAPRPGAAAGPVGALRRVLTTALGMGRTRLELLGNELQIEKHRALQQLVRAVLAVFCICMALVLGVVLVVTVWWEQRVAVLGGLIALFLLVAAGLAQSLRKARSRQEHPFAASLAELQEDLSQLKAATHHAAPQEPR
ncbi:phage holin family protein [Pseudorhodoferax sp.]|uniref:phage holin family protein n=1 Tax=Pseudorhodoferax sp. TaxID=1993553 RepID=UPI0039E695F2